MIEVVVTNTIDLADEKKCSKIKVLSVAPFLAKAIHSIHDDVSVSKLIK